MPWADAQPVVLPLESMLLKVADLEVLLRRPRAGGRASALAKPAGAPSLVAHKAGLGVRKIQQTRVL